ncbi:MAG: 50S ribosomal protein L21, partial [Bacillota bacterium]
MYAIVKTGGKQYRLGEGDQVRIEKLEAEVGSEVILDQVFLVSKDDGETIFGTPTIPDARVVTRVLEHGKADKILVFKYKSKANYRRRYGHRQPYTEIKVEKIELGVAPA